MKRYGYAAVVIYAALIVLAMLDQPSQLEFVS